jgi:hypothetical protein
VLGLRENPALELLAAEELQRVARLVARRLAEISARRLLRTATGALLAAVEGPQAGKGGAGGAERLEGARLESAIQGRRRRLREAQEAQAEAAVREAARGG